MAIAEAFAGAVQGLGNVGIGIWNAYQQQKNYEYQKQLQQKIFEREDNALQRRVADAEKAGYNKFAVLGQGAGAGSVVSTTAPQVDESLGSRAADALQHAYQLAVDKESAKIAKLDRQIKENERQMSFNARNIDAMSTSLKQAELLRMMGFEVSNFNLSQEEDKDNPGNYRHDYWPSLIFRKDDYHGFYPNDSGYQAESSYHRSPAKSMLDQAIMDSIWLPHLHKSQAQEAGKRNKWYDTMRRWQIANDIVHNILDVGKMM